MSKPGLLTLTIKDKSALYLAYMPFVINGGLFIPTNSSYRLGDEVFMLLNLMGEEEKIPVAGTVIWMTPKGAQGKRTAGIGVQFSDQDQGNTQKKIETYLAHRALRDRQILEGLRSEARTISELVERIYTDVPRFLHGAAGMSVHAHLRKLERDGLARREGDEWIAS